MQYHVPNMVTSILAAFGLELCMGAQNVLTVYSLEQLPTQLRSSGFGVLVAFGQISTWLGPVMCSLNLYTLSDLEAGWMSFGLSYFAIIMGALVPRNSNRLMPQTVDQFYHNAKGHFATKNKETERP